MGDGCLTNKIKTNMFREIAERPVMDKLSKGSTLLQLC